MIATLYNSLIHEPYWVRFVIAWGGYGMAAAGILYAMKRFGG